MSDHVHEWEILTDRFGIREAKCFSCDASIGQIEIHRRLNATERLSAEDALFAEADGYSDNEHAERQPWQDAVRAYAIALEGEDE